MAKKYIDASRLKAEIERRNLTNYCGTAEQYEEELFAIIDSLQQEQPCDTCTNDKGCVTCKDGELWEGKEVDLEKDAVQYCFDKGLNVTPYQAKTIARHFYILGLKNNIPVTQITLDELAKERESVNEDLEEASEEYMQLVKARFLRTLEHPTAKDCFIAGAEWQAERLLKGSPMPEDTVIFQKGIEEGKRLMMEEAVEGEVVGQEQDIVEGHHYLRDIIKLNNSDLIGVEFGDKVKIVIVKED